MPANLVAYSGFSASNYLQQPYNSALDFGTGNFCVMGWINTTDSTINVIMSKSPPSSITSPYFEFQMGGGSVTWVHTSGGSLSFGSINSGTWRHLVYVRSSGVGYGYKDGVLIGSHANTGDYNHSNTDTLRFGYRQDGYSGAFLTGSLALWKISASVPSPEQIKKIYEDEKMLFQENSQATLYGASDAVTALAYDDDNQLLHVGTSSGRSDFQGLRRINNTTTAVTTAISASNGLIAEQ